MLIAFLGNKESEYLVFYLYIAYKICVYES